MTNTFNGFYQAAYDLVSQGFTKDYLAVDAKKKPCNQYGNYVITYDKSNKEVSRVHVPVKEWSLVGALMAVTESKTFPNALCTKLMEPIQERTKALGFPFMTVWESDKKTTQADVLALLKEFC